MSTKKPNIVFILSDDQGAWAMGCSGNEEIITPNLDRLAAEGMRFENFFCESPVCSPARASLLTGRIPSQHGVHDWIRDDNKKQEDIEYLAGQTAYTDILAQEGYVCGLSGKWHLGRVLYLKRVLHTGLRTNLAEALIMVLLFTERAVWSMNLVMSRMSSRMTPFLF